MVDRCIIGEGTEIRGEVRNSVIGPGVTIEEGAVVNDSIVMQDSVIKKGARLDKAIVAQNVVIGENAVIGTGEFAESTYNKKVYNADLVTIGEDSVVPANVTVGRNTAIIGVTEAGDYPDGILPSGGAIIKAMTIDDKLSSQKEGDN